MSLLGTAKTLRLMSEFVFVLLGILLAQVAYSGRLFWDRRSVLWIGLAFFLLFRSAVALMPRASVARGPERLARAVRGGMLGVVGVLMLGIAWLPFAWVAPLLGVAGLTLVVGGIASAIFVWRTT